MALQKEQRLLYKDHDFESISNFVNFYDNRKLKQIKYEYFADYAPLNKKLKIDFKLCCWMIEKALVSLLTQILLIEVIGLKKKQKRKRSPDLR